MNKMRCIFLLTAIAVISHAQDNSIQSDYELLTLEIDLLRSYHSFSATVNAMIDSAASYAATDEYEVAVVYLEEAKEVLNKAKNQDINDIKSIAEKEIFIVNFTTGIDYNRQEFELGYEQSDSVLKEEINKPFIGFNVQMNFDNNMQLENLLRYDKENFQEELCFKKEYATALNEWGFSTGFIYDNNYRYTELGYNQLSAEVYLKSTNFGSNWYWNIKNTTRFKNYARESEVLPDFFRNTFSAYVSRGFNQYDGIQVDYNLDYNESLKYANNDFLEHDMGIGYEAVYFNHIRFKAVTRYRYNDFSYLLSDSTFSNISQTITFNPEVRFNIYNSLSLDLEYKLDKKTYNEKTEYEPDYTLNSFNPAFVYHFNDFSSLSLGYVYEGKNHEIDASLDKQYILDQDYYSKGISAGMDFSSTSGLLISMSAEYVLRRYPNSQSDANFNIYSNRNVFSLLLFTQIPLGDNILLNAIGSYDNDKDIDSDFNDTVTSFYTIEFLYRL